MNRRTFFATLSAIAAAVGLKLKLPAATPPKYVIGCDPAQKYEDYMRYIYIKSKDGTHKWLPKEAQIAFAKRYGLKL